MPDIVPGELRDLEIEEISIVDKPAIGRKFVIMKRGGSMEDEVEKLNSETEEVEKTEEETQPEEVEKVEEEVEEEVEKVEEEETEEPVEKNSDPVAGRLASVEAKLEALDERVTKILDAIEDVQEIGKRLVKRKAAVNKAEEEEAEKPRTVADLRKALRKTLEVQFGISD
jgi:DNA repair exonuclease SbcCD ATPase subunit